MRNILRRIVGRLAPQVVDAHRRLFQIETMLVAVSERLSVAAERNERRLGLLETHLLKIDQNSVSVEQRLGVIDEHLVQIGQHLVQIDQRSVLIAQRSVLIDQRSALIDQRSATIQQQVESLEQSISAAAERLALIEGRQSALHHDVHHLLARHLVPLDDDYIGAMTPNGWVVLPAEEHAFLVLTDGWFVHEPGTVATLQALLASGDVAVDAGAHVGLLTVPMARQVGPTGCVIAAEPMPRSAGALRRSLAANGLLDRVELHEVAVHRAAGQMPLHLGHNAMMASVIAADDKYGTIKVKTATVDQLLGERVAAVVKLDVEGAELDALAGMSATIAASPDIVVVAEFGPSHLLSAGTSVEHWLNAFAALGLDCMLEIDDATQQCVPLRPVVALAEVYSLNLLFSRAGNQRLRALPGVNAEMVH